jgi:hypothetical protein
MRFFYSAIIGFYNGGRVFSFAFKLGQFKFYQQSYSHKLSIVATRPETSERISKYKNLILKRFTSPKRARKAKMIEV